MPLTVGGTVATYQGWHCTSVEIVRGAGFEPDTSIVQIYVADFPKLKFALTNEPVPGVSILSVDVPEQRDAEGRAADLPGFASVGTILVREEVPGELPRIKRLEGFHLVSARQEDSRRRDGIVTLTLTDDRAFLRRGRLSARRFNLRDDNGDPFEDTLDDGKSFTVRALVEAILGSVFSRPALRRVPPRWEIEPASFEFDPGTDPRTALEQVVERFPARLALHWDRSFGFYLSGEIPDGARVLGETIGNADEGGGNQFPILDSFITGSERGLAFENRPEFLVVVGGSRIQTVRVLCEPVGEVDSEPRPLELGLAELIEQEAQRERERIERRGGRAEEPPVRGRDQAKPKSAQRPAESPPPRIDRFTLEIVQKLVLRPEAYRGRAVSSLAGGASRDGYQLWRVVGADGFNRGLLPIRDRAETRGGIRLKPLLQTHRWLKRQGEVRLLGGALGSTTTGVEAIDPRNRFQAVETARLIAEARLAKARNEIFSLRKRPLDPTAEPFVGPEPGVLGDIAPRTPREQVASRLARARKAHSQVVANVGRAFVDARPEFFDVESIRRAGRDGLGQLEPELVAEIAIEELSEPFKGRMRSALAAFRAERAARNKLDPFHADTLEFGQALDKIGEAIREGNRKPIELVVAARAQARRLIEAQEKRIFQTFKERTEELLPHASYFSNEPLKNDPTAVLESARLGTFRTAGAVGHLRDQDLPKDSLLGSRLVPMPVFAIFGARITRSALKALEFQRAAERLAAEALRRAGALLGRAGQLLGQVLDPFAGDPELAQRNRDRALALVIQGAGSSVELVDALGLGRLAPLPVLTDPESATPRKLEDLSDEEIENVVFAFQRVGNEVKEIKLEDVPVGQERVLKRPDLVELIQIDGQTNREALRREALIDAREQLLQVRQLEAARVTLTRPFRVNPNGLVARTTIRSREGMLGFETIVDLGTETQPERRGASTFVPSKLQIAPAPRPDQTKG